MKYYEVKYKVIVIIHGKVYKRKGFKKILVDRSERYRELGMEDFGVVKEKQISSLLWATKKEWEKYIQSKIDDNGRLWCYIDWACWEPAIRFEQVDRIEIRIKEKDRVPIENKTLDWLSKNVSAKILVEEFGANCPFIKGD